MKPRNEVPYFLLASHLASLARQLRFAGFDCRILSSVEDKALPRILSGEERHLLTRIRAPLPPALEGRTLHLRSPQLDAQMLEVAQAFDLQASFNPFNRCTLCNKPLKKLSMKEVKKEQAKGKIPAALTEKQYDFRHCPDCGRIYWPGDHYRRMKRRWEEIFEKISEEKE